MVTEAAGAKLGRLIRRARTSRRLRSADDDRDEGPAPSVGDIDIERIDALVRAEAAEEKVAQLTAELAHKEEILAEARQALRTARLALRDHLRLTEP